MDKIVAICGITRVSGSDEYLVNEAVSREIRRQRALANAEHGREMAEITKTMSELTCQRDNAVASRNRLLAQNLRKRRRTSTRFGRFVDKVELCWAYAYSLCLVLLWRI